MLSKKRLKSMRAHAEYTLKNGGYNINPVPDANSVIALIEEIERLQGLVEKYKRTRFVETGR